MPVCSPGEKPHASAHKLASSRKKTLPLQAEPSNMGVCVSPSLNTDYWGILLASSPTSPGLSLKLWDPFLYIKQMIGEYSIIIKSPQDNRYFHILKWLRGKAQLVLKKTKKTKKPKIFSKILIKPVVLFSLVLFFPVEERFSFCTSTRSARCC